jgi:hypothetical protein
MAGFTGRYVSSSYQEIVRISGSKFADGTGSYINAVTLGDVTVTGSLILDNLNQVSQSHLLTINPSNGQVYYTSTSSLTTPIAPISVTGSNVGINNSLPNYSLDVSGSGNFTNGLTVSGSLLISGSISTLSSTANGQSISIGTGSVSFQNSIAVGNRSRAGDGSGINGCIAVGLDVTASGDFNAAFGRDAVASPGDGGAIAAGYNVTATGVGSAAFGRITVASSDFAFACNRSTTASGPASFAAGSGSVALGSGSAAFGLLTIASGSNQFVVGQYNSRNNTSSLFVVGGGSGDVSNRKDIFDVRIDSNYSASIQIPTNPSAPSNPVSGSMYWSGSFIYLYTGAGATGWQSASLA